MKMDTLEELLNKYISFPDNGELHKKGTVEGLMVLVWNFHHYTSCTSASLENFNFVKVKNDDPFKLAHPFPRGTVSLPFFVINDKYDDVFYDINNQVVKIDYAYPDVPERCRVEALRTSLQAHKYDVIRLAGTKTSHHYCEFSRGGDLCINKEVNYNLPLVFHFPGAVTYDELNKAEPDENNLQSNSSPKVRGDSKLASLSIEAKKGTVNIENVRYQLWASMMIIAVNNLVEAIELLTKKDLMAITQLTGYGIVCGGNGTLGVYKLKMVFGTDKKEETE